MFDTYYMCGERVELTPAVTDKKLRVSREDYHMLTRKKIDDHPVINYCSGRPAYCWRSDPLIRVEVDEEVETVGFNKIKDAVEEVVWG